MVLSNYVVAFIDILGQRETFEQSPKLIQDLEDPKEFLINTYGKVEKLKGLINNLKSGWDSHPSPFLKILEFTIPDINHSKFSDCLEIHSSMISKTGKELAIASIYYTLIACSGVSLFSLVYGFAVRGGMTIGIGIEDEEKSVYGPALYEAVVLEEKKAIYPRILLSNELINYINKIRSIDPSDKKAELEKSIAERCFDYIDLLNGEYFVSFLSEKSLEIYNPNQKKEITDKAKEFVENQIAKYVDRPDVLRKYRWIVDYDNQKNSILNIT